MNKFESQRLPGIPTDTAYSYHSALVLRERGFSVIPMRGKVPALNAWKEYQTRRPSENELRAWFAPENSNRFNVGVVCGKVSDLVVVDCDSREAEEWFQARNPRVKTPLTARSGSGGLHHYFKYPTIGEPVRNRQGVAGVDLDIRGDGGVITCPPSVHPKTERPYQWVTPLIDISLDDIPEFDPSWIPNKNRDAARPVHHSSNGVSDRVLSRARKYIRKIESVQGERGSNACFRAACYLRDRGLSQEQALRELTAWNEEGYAKPPWSQKELLHKIESAFS